MVFLLTILLIYSSRSRRACRKDSRKSKISVAFPDQKASGYPYISYGELDKAKKNAEYNIERLWPLVQSGHEIVTTEPTAAYSLSVVYPKLMDNSEASLQIAEATYPFFAYLAKLIRESFLFLPPTITESRKFGFHIPCHDRGLSSGRETLQILKSIGLDVGVIETGTCCGMAGTFGLKKGPLGYDLSMAVGEKLFDCLRNEEVDAIISESSVCKVQLEDGAGLPVYHPLELISSL